MANNRRDRTTDLPGDGDQKISSGPEIISVTVHPSPNLAAAPKPAQGDIWASLLESSPWSANQGGRVEAAQPSSAPIRSQDPVPVADLVNRWSQPIWRTATLAENAEASEESGVAPSLTLSGSVLAVSDLVIDVQPDLNAEVEVSAEPETVVELAEEIALINEGTSLEVAEVEPEPALVEAVAEPEIEVAEVEPEPALVEAVAEPEIEVAEVKPEPALVEAVAEPEIEVAEVESEPAPVEAVAEPVIEIEVEAIEVEPEPALVEAVAEPVIEIEVEAIEVEPEPALVEAVVEPVTEFAHTQAESVASADLIAHPAPAESSRLAELLEEAAVAAPAVAVAVEATRQPNKIAASVKKRAPVQEVPVEDLLGGMFGVAGSAVRGVFSIGGGFVDGVVKGGRLVGSNVVAGTRRLAQTIEGSCGSCSSPKCDAEGKKK